MGHKFRVGGALFALMFCNILPVVAQPKSGSGPGQKPVRTVIPGNRGGPGGVIAHLLVNKLTVRLKETHQAQL